MKRLIEINHAGEYGMLLSDCGSYQYRVWREWDASRPALAFLMLNPSAADEHDEDPTLTRCFACAVANDFGRLEMVNLFPLRTTSPEELLTHPDPLGPRNAANVSILDVVDRAAMVICAWGSHKTTAARAADVMQLLRITGMHARLFHLGLNKDGSPKHPLYIAANTQPNSFRPEIAPTRWS